MKAWMLYAGVLLVACALIAIYFVSQQVYVRDPGIDTRVSPAPTVID